MEGFGDFGGKKVAAPEDVAKMKAALEELRNAMVGSEDDPDQNALVKVIQRNRAFLLEYALSAYIDNPKNAKLLEGVTQIIAQIEKVVRDDRKEALKKKDQDNNKVGFNQMMEALQNISNGSVRMPTFNFSDFILDPTKSIIAEHSKMDPISEQELLQGNSLIDMDGVSMGKFNG